MITRAQMPRQLRNRGGIMTIKTIRQKYGLGDLVRKLIPKEIARVAEVAAPIVAIANPALAPFAAVAGGLGRFKRTGDLGSSALYGAGVQFAGAASPGFKTLGTKGATTFGSGITKNILLGKEGGTGLLKDKGLFGAAGKFSLGEAIGKGTPGIFLGTTALSLLGQKLVGPKKEDETEGEYLARRKTAVGGYLRKYYSQLNPTASATDVESFVQRNLVEYKAEGGRIGYAEGTPQEMFPDNIDDIGPRRSEPKLRKMPEFKGDEVIPNDMMMTSAPGPKDDYDDIARQLFGKGYKDLTPEEMEMMQEELERLMNKFRGAEGGITDIPVRMNSEGVKELDMRKSGGFVPIGVKEKADDVPAMLSKNEFVMTADAVRAAGGGSINKGAQRMYDTMKKLESRVA